MSRVLFIQSLFKLNAQVLSRIYIHLVIVFLKIIIKETSAKATVEFNYFTVKNKVPVQLDVFISRIWKKVGNRRMCMLLEHSY